VITNSQQLVQTGYTYTSSVKMISLGIAHLVIKHLSCPCFHQEAIILMGLIRLIYLFIY